MKLEALVRRRPAKNAVQLELTNSVLQLNTWDELASSSMVFLGFLKCLLIANFFSVSGTAR